MPLIREFGCGTLAREAGSRDESTRFSNVVTQFSVSESDLWRTKLLLAVLMRRVAWSLWERSWTRRVAVSPVNDGPFLSRENGVSVHDLMSRDDKETGTTVPRYAEDVGEDENECESNSDDSSAGAEVETALGGYSCIGT